MRWPRDVEHAVEQSRVVERIDIRYILYISLGPSALRASRLPLDVERVRVRAGVRGHEVDDALELHVANLRVLLRVHAS